MRGVGIGLWFAAHGDLLLTALYLILEQVIFEFKVGNAPLTISTFVIYKDCPGRERTAACQALGQLTFDGFDRSSTLVHLKLPDRVHISHQVNKKVAVSLCPQFCVASRLKCSGTNQVGQLFWYVRPISCQSDLNTPYLFVRN